VTETANTLGAIVDEAQSLEEVRKQDLRSGDRVLVTTTNSSYTILVLDDGQFCVWGGWFDRQGAAPRRVTINGCTWGGSVIKHDVVAACGLRLEFGNQVLTTPIQSFTVMGPDAQPLRSVSFAAPHPQIAKRWGQNCD